MSNDLYGMDQEIIRRLVERIIKLEVDQETLKRRVDDPLVGNDIFGNDEDGSNSKIMLWNRILRLEEGQQVVQKHVQELFANVMDFELQSRGEPCYLHDQGNMVSNERTLKQQWLYDLRKSLTRSTHPGLKHLTEFVHPALRCLWLLFLLMAVFVCGVAVYHSYDTWSKSSSTFTYSSVKVPLGAIPFPAVTVCPERNIGSGVSLDSLLSNHCTEWACSRDQFDKLSAAAFLCPALMQTLPVHAWSNYYNTTSSTFMHQLMARCNEDIASFHWTDKATETNCSKAFQTLYIDDRVCYSYNMLPASYIFKANMSSQPVLTDDTGLAARPGWTPHFLGRPEPWDKTIPLHHDWAGEDFKLKIELDRKSFNQTNCTDLFQVFQVTVHHPAELPTRASHHYLRLPVNHSLLIAVTPHLQSSHQECVEPQEGGLKMFRHYSSTKCHLECRVKCSVNLCGCVPLYHPRMDNETKWCGIYFRHCPDTLVPELLRGKISWKSITKHFRMYIKGELRESVTDLLYRHRLERDKADQEVEALRPDCSCHCPPDCATVTYSLDTQLVPLPGGSRHGSQKNRSEISIYYKEGIETVTATERRVMNYFIDFLAHFGGLVALLTGVSVLSLVEMLYLGLATLLRRQDGGYVSRQTSCVRRKQEWDKTAQTDPIFITDGQFNMGF